MEKENHFSTKPIDYWESGASVTGTLRCENSSHAYQIPQGAVNISGYIPVVVGIYCVKNEL